MFVNLSHVTVATIYNFTLLKINYFIHLPDGFHKCLVEAKMCKAGDRLGRRRSRDLHVELLLKVDDLDVVEADNVLVLLVEVLSLNIWRAAGFRGQLLSHEFKMFSNAGYRVSIVVASFGWRTSTETHTRYLLLKFWTRIRIVFSWHSGSGFGSFCHQAKIVRKVLIPTV